MWLIITSELVLVFGVVYLEMLRKGANIQPVKLLPTCVTRPGICYANKLSNFNAWFVRSLTTILCRAHSNIFDEYTI